jgi:ribosome biogenesis protein SSF1/2
VKSKITLDNFIKFTKMAKGPTFTFNVLKYSNNTDLHQLLPRAKALTTKNLGSPLVILNGFGSEVEVPQAKDAASTDNPSGIQERKLMATMFNNLFPSLNLNQAKPSALKRVVLVNFDSTRDVIEWRHYYIKQNYTDINNKIKKIVNSKKIPNLSECKDLSQYFAGNVGYASESDIDNLPNSKINVEEEMKSGKVQKKKVNLRLFEIGPRITMKLVKIEEGLLSVFCL